MKKILITVFLLILFPTTFVSADVQGDTIPPEITIIGDNPMHKDLGEYLNDPGATAFDNIDGDLSGYIITMTSCGSIYDPGPCIVIYDVADKSGNEAREYRNVWYGPEPTPTEPYPGPYPDPENIAITTPTPWWVTFLPFITK